MDPATPQAARPRPAAPSLVGARAAARAARLAAPLALLLAACQPQDPTAPSLILQSTPGDVDQVKLHWSPPDQGDFSGFVLEVRQVPGEFTAVATLGPRVRDLAYTFPATVAEGTEQELRLRALPEPSGPRLSQVLPFHRGLRTPRLSGGSILGLAEGEALTFANTSLAAEALELTRRVGCAPATGTVDLVRSFDPGVTTFTEDDWSPLTDGGAFGYELRAVKGAERSAPALQTSVHAPLLAPTGATLQRVGQDFRVSFVQQSRCATQVVLQATAATGVPLSTSPGVLMPAPAQGAAGTITHRLQVPGLYAYRPCAGREGAIGCAPPVFGVVAPSTLDATAVEPPPGRTVVRTSAGFATAHTTGDGRLLLRAATAGGEDLLTLPAATLGTHGLLLAPDGRPHALVVQLAAASPETFVLVHAWHDGSAWLQEEVAPAGADPASNPRDATMAIGPEGTAHVAWHEGSSSLAVATRRAGGWESSLLPFLPDPFLLAGDAGGEPHALVIGRTVTHQFKEGGAWTAEPVPTPPSGELGTPVYAFGGGDGLVVAWLNTSSPSRIQVTRRPASGSTWSAPTVVAEYTAQRAANQWPPVLSHSADGARLGVAVEEVHDFHVGDLQRLWIVDGAGVAGHGWFPADDAKRPSFDLGFGPGGKAWLLEGTSDAPEAAPFPAVLFEER